MVKKLNLELQSHEVLRSTWLLVTDWAERVFSVPRFIGLPIDEADFAIRGSGLNTGSVIINVVDEEKLVELVELAKELEIDTVYNH
jgi:hypothetical protein